MKQNKKHGTAALIILALIALIIVPVSAETLTGTLGGATYSQTTIDVTGTATTFPIDFAVIKVINLEYSGDTLAMVHFDDGDPTPRTASFSGGAPTYYNTPFNAYLDSDTGVFIVSGTIGYARSFNVLGWEQPGYQWVQFNNDWNLTGSGKTGDHYLHLMHTGIYGCTYSWTVSSTAPGNGDMYFIRTGISGANVPTGITMRTIDESTMSSYSATKPAGLGISGTVSKSPSGVPYTSKIFIQDSSSNVFVSEDLMNSNNFTFNVPKDQIYIKMLSPSGVWYNSSILFAPTVTPTPTTTWTGTDPIPAGYVRTWFNAVDGTAGSVIYGAALKLKDVQNGSWKNNTAGYSYIDTLPSHTIDAYGTMTGYTGDTRLGLPAADTVYELTLWSGLITPATGKVNLIILVTDETTGQTISGATVTARLTTSATWGGVTGSAGTSIFEVPNMTYVIGTASKPGYESRTAAITTTAFGPDTLRIAIPLSRVTVTATATPLPGHLTVAPTIDTNDPSRNGGDTSLKAQEMMNWLAMNGMDLVQLCFLVTVLALLGVKFGK